MSAVCTDGSSSTTNTLVGVMRNLTPTIPEVGIRGAYHIGLLSREGPRHRFDQKTLVEGFAQECDRSSVGAPPLCGKDSVLRRNEYDGNRAFLLIQTVRELEAAHPAQVNVEYETDVSLDRAAEKRFGRCKCRHLEARGAQQAGQTATHAEVIIDYDNRHCFLSPRS